MSKYTQGETTGWAIAIYRYHKGAVVELSSHIHSAIVTSTQHPHQFTSFQALETASNVWLSWNTLTRTFKGIQHKYFKKNIVTGELDVERKTAINTSD